MWCSAPDRAPIAPELREGSHGHRAGPTCCICFHSAEAVAVIPLVVDSRPRYIMSTAPWLPGQRVFPSLLPMPVPAQLWFWAQPKTQDAAEGAG